MSLKRFSIFQLMLVMLVVCVLAAAVGQLASGRTQLSPFIFMLMLVCSPMLLVVVLSLIRSFTKR